MEVSETRMHILDQMRPGLSEALLQLPRESQIDVFIAACEIAYHRSDDIGDVGKPLFKEMFARRALTLESAQLALVLSEEADDRYLTLHEAEELETVWIPFFVKALPLRSLWIVFGDQSERAVVDAIYDLTCTTDDPTPIIESVGNNKGTE